MDASTSTELLVTAAQRGSREALEELFRRYLPRVRRIVAMRLNKPARAFEEHEDLVQDSMLDALRSLDRFEARSDGRFCNWLARSIENNLRDHLRRAGAEKRGAGRERPLADYGSTTLSESVFAGREPSPSQHARAKELDEALERAMLDLSPRYREAILLRAVCGMSAREMAEEMGMDSAEIAQKVFERARRRLEEKLDLDGGHE